MNRLTLGIVGLLAGIALIAGQLLTHDAGAVFTLLADNALGIVLVSMFHLLPIAFDSIAWQRLCPPALGPWRCLELGWIGQSVNALLPVAQVGGDVLRAVLAAGTIPAATAVASVIIDLSLAALTQGLFTLLGIALLLSVPASDLSGELEWLGWAVLAITIMTLALLVAIFAQHGGLFAKLTGLLSRAFKGPKLQRLSAHGESLDIALRAGWRDLHALARASTWRSAGWLIGSGEIWLGLWFLGHPVGLLEAVLLESLVQAARSAAFFMPGGLGVQEGGYLLIGALLGIDAEVLLALGLMKRATHLLTGLPALLWLARIRTRH